MAASGALASDRENLVEGTSISLSGRTHVRSRSPRLAASGPRSNVGKGSRQNGSVTSGEGLALRAGMVGLGEEAGRTARTPTRTRSSRGRDVRGNPWVPRAERPRTARVRRRRTGLVSAGPRAGVRLRRSGVNRRDLRLKLSQNCHGQGESDCLIKTERLDRLKSFLRDVISAQCSECQSEEIRISAGKRRE